MISLETEYFGIPEDILDGIHPEEDCFKFDEADIEDTIKSDNADVDRINIHDANVKETIKSENEDAGKIQVDNESWKMNFYCEGATSSRCCVIETGRQMRKETPKKAKSQKRLDNVENFEVLSFLLSYTNHHISILFILVLSLTNLILSSLASIMVTALVIVGIVVLDCQFAIGIRNI
jgi:hypothetical protein